MPNNLLLNGGFNGNLWQWSGSGAIDRANGYPRLGCVSLAAGQNIAQQRDLGENWLYTVHFFYQLATGATLTASYGSISQTFTGTPLNVWREGQLTFALDTGGSGSVTFAASGGACLVDSVSLIAGGLPITRSAIATAVAARMASLVADASLSSTASASGPEGDYSLAIDEALRALGAVSTFGSAGLLVPTDGFSGTWGDPDVTALDYSKVNDVIDAAQDALLTRLRATYMLKSDVSLGPRTEHFSQIAGMISDMLGGGSKGGGGRVSVGKLTHGDWPR